MTLDPIALGAILAMLLVAALLLWWLYRSRRTSALTATVPLEAQLFLRPLRFLGIGVAGVADVNAERSFAGLLVGVQVGRLDPRGRVARLSGRR